MKKKIVGICICMLLVLTSTTALGTKIIDDTNAILVNNSEYNLRISVEAPRPKVYRQHKDITFTITVEWLEGSVCDSYTIEFNFWNEDEDITVIGVDIESEGPIGDPGSGYPSSRVHSYPQKFYTRGNWWVFVTINSEFDINPVDDEGYDTFYVLNIGSKTVRKAVNTPFLRLIETLRGHFPLLERLLELL